MASLRHVPAADVRSSDSPEVSPLAALLEVGSVDDDSWVGYTPSGSARPDIFGGQVAGQALRAATLTVDGPHLPNSVHCYFLRRGRSTEPAGISVRRVRDGRTYASRQVEVTQGGRAIFAMMASFHAPEPGRNRCRSIPDDVPDPEGLEPDIPAMWDPLIEVRPVPNSAVAPLTAAPLTTAVAPPATPPMRWWGRVTGPFPAEVNLHYCALLYASDLRAGSAALVAAGLGDGLSPRRDDRGRLVGNFGSLDHALWFHRPPAVDEWFFCEVRPSTVTDSRGLVEGDMFDRSGRHLASFAQEMFLKEHDPSPFGEGGYEAR